MQQPSSQLLSIVEQVLATLQGISQQNVPSSVLIIPDVLNSINTTASSLPYSWLIDGVLPGYRSSGGSNSEYCFWVKRGIQAGKNLSAIVEMEEEVKSLKAETKSLQQREEILRVEKKALSRRLEDSETMLEKYMKEMKLVKEEENESKKKNEIDEISTLKKENKVCSHSPLCP